MTLLLWTSCLICFFLSLKILFRELAFLSGGVGFARQRRILQRVADLLREIEDTLTAGMIPNQQLWLELGKCPEPWGPLAFESLQELRRSGGSLLPTLQRLRALAEEQIAALADAGAKSSQAFAQAGACSALVPLVGGALYQLLPGIAQQSWSWWIACGVALILTGIGAVWLLCMADAARWGGILSENRGWVLGAQCAGERFLALVRSGVPPDLAWGKACEFLSQNTKTLAATWGYSIWDIPNMKVKGRAEQVIVQVGVSIRKAVQVSLMEGRPCSDRVESVLLAMRQDLKALRERELSLLGTRALKPLFVCVAPALMGLLFFGLWIVANGVMEDGTF